MHHPEPTGRPTAAIVLSSVLALLALVISLVFVAAAAAEDCRDCGDGDPDPPTIIYPATTITAKPETLSTQTRPTFSYKSDLSNSTYQCRFAGSASEGWSSTDDFACGSTAAATSSTSWQPSTPQADGTHYFQVRACKQFLDADTGEYVTRCDGTPSKATYTIDTTGPTATFTSGPAHDARIRTLPSYAFTGADAGGPGFYCWIDGVRNTSCTSPQTFAGNLAQGTHHVQVLAHDVLGNAGPIVTRSFVWDTVAPTTTLKVPELTADATPTLQYDITADGGGTGSFACELDAKPVPCVGDGGGGAYTPTTPLPDGQHTFRVQAADSTGNVGTWSQPATFAVDTTAPAIGALTYDAAATTVSFASADAVAGWRCKVDAGAFADCTSPFSVGTLAPGTHTVTVQARDAAGNTREEELTLAIAAPTKDEPAPQGDGGTTTGDTTSSGAASTGAAAASTAASARPSAATAPAAKKKAKPRCRIVKKKVRGKTRKVKVCAKKKAKKAKKPAKKS